MEPQNQGWKLSHGQGQHPRKVGDVWSIIELFPEGTLNTTKQPQCVWEGPQVHPAGSRGNGNSIELQKGVRAAVLTQENVLVRERPQ